VFDNIWNEWADENGELGPVYGAQWRHWKSAEGEVIDQISEAMELIKNSPDSRRILVSSWNVGELESMALQPCHVIFQFYVANGQLSCQLYQRSADIFLGVPFNIASYSLLTFMIAQVCKLEVGEFIHTLGDAHIYLNHIEQVNLQLTRDPLELPKLKLNETVKSIEDFKYEDIEIVDYKFHPPIKGKISI
jgi:thymidylate synthase